MENAKRIIHERSLLHYNDPSIERYWERLIVELSQNVNETIIFLESCSKDEVAYVSEVFEEIAYNLQSTEYISCLKRCALKFPELKLSHCIEVAESYMG